MNTNLDQALASLPHGPDFRFVDSLTELEPGIRARGRLQVKETDEFLKSHFPGNPMMPGVLLIEAIAQVAGIAAQDSSDGESSADLRLAAVSQAKIGGAACPGDLLLIEVEITGRLGGLIQAEGQIMMDGKQAGDAQVLATAKITLSGAA